MRNGYGILFLLLLFHLAVPAQEPVDFVNPFIGTSNYGATYPGPVRPWGMASVVPFNVAFKKGAENQFEKDSEWHSRPYVAENKFLTGYSHVNLSGVGCPELGSILLMPTHGQLELNPEHYGSTYQDEVATPGYYAHTLDKYSIKTELTATLRTGLSKYTFPQGQSHIILNLGLGLTNETGAALKILSETEVVGHKLIGTFCYNPEDVRPVYFAIKFSKPATNFGAWKKMPPFKGVEAEWTKYNDTIKPYPQFRYELAGDDIGAYFSFETENEEVVYAKVGISYVSIENARQNLQGEQPDFNFDKTRQDARLTWNNLLKRIKVDGGSKDDKTNFYSALYHTLIHPNILQDANGEYPLMEKYGTGNTSENRYTVFSLWDTYRNVHPFLSLVYPEVQSQMVKSMIAMYKESGWLPKWELLGMETSVMVGDPATPVIADTYLRGIRDFDIQTAYEAIKKSATAPDSVNKLRPGIGKYRTLGYIPENHYENVWGTVSTSLEYNIADWNLAQLAKALNKKEDYRNFLKQSASYRNYYDPSTGMLRPRMEKGEWLTPFNPKAGANFEPVIGFVEGNAWQYRFYVPHDIKNLIKMLGGKSRFIKELQLCFDDGNYDMANEPDITYPFLFNFVKGEEWRAQKMVNQLIHKHYFDGPAGLPGNDDTGTLSTWLLFSMLGIYPHCPGDMSYAIVSPTFDKVTIALNANYYPGKELTIEANKSSKNAIYIQNLEVNGQKYNRYFIDHDTLVKGAHLKFELTETRKP
ncbi:GH92 family glycosyl hydrolase [Fulvivirgaceae bacterium BMA12]|uniref:GH92 family glycosyl hydrolase n=1 Tax=Agaribacillus aureus TaxID=3051825 RepID=A0ABT8LCB3_9BACT|nr:GH92 family glycosyl hydrolase [Fulvivirgaceae bacterium BMA12]